MNANKNNVEAKKSNPQEYKNGPTSPVFELPQSNPSHFSLHAHSECKVFALKAHFPFPEQTCESSFVYFPHFLE